MDKFFGVDGTFYTIMSKVADLIVASFIWIIGCIPIVTIFVSTASLYYTVVKCIRYDQGRIIAEFWNAYKKNLWQGIELMLVYGCVGTILALADYYVFVQSTNRSSLFFFLTIGVLGFSLLYLLNLLWMPVVLSRFSNSFGNLLKLNYVIAIKNIPKSIVILLVISASVILCLVMNELIFMLPAVAVFVNSFLSEPTLWRYMPELTENERDWRYGLR